MKSHPSMPLSPEGTSGLGHLPALPRHTAWLLLPLPCPAILYHFRSVPVTALVGMRGTFYLWSHSERVLTQPYGHPQSRAGMAPTGPEDSVPHKHSPRHPGAAHGIPYKGLQRVGRAGTEERSP